MGNLQCINIDDAEDGPDVSSVSTIIYKYDVQGRWKT